MIETCQKVTKPSWRSSHCPNVGQFEHQKEKYMMLDYSILKRIKLSIILPKKEEIQRNLFKCHQMLGMTELEYHYQHTVISDSQSFQSILKSMG